MTPVRLFLVFQLFAAVLVAPVFQSTLLAQPAESDQAEEGATSDRKPGITVIVDAAGPVQIIDNPGAAPRPAQKGDRIPVEGTILTGPGAQANLALSNGAFFQILENSSFSIAEFEQAAYEFVFANGAAIRKKDAQEFGADEAVLTALDSSEEAWNKLPSEPTESATKFELNFGTMIGESKKLKPGSKMEITTPIGVAGIRGTIWRFTVQPVGGPGSNRFRGNLDVSTGRVDFRNQEGTRSVQVQGGFGMNVDGVVQAGNVRLEGLATTPLSAERQLLLNTTIRDVANVQEVFSAIQGSPDVVLEVVRSLSGVDASNPQAVADAALSIMSGDPAQAKLVAQVATAVVVLQVTPDLAPRVVSEVVSAMTTQSPNLAPNIVSGVVSATTNAANNDLIPRSTAQAVNNNAVSTASAAAPTQAGAIQSAAQSTEAERFRNPSPDRANNNRETGDTNQTPQVDTPTATLINPGGGTGNITPVVPPPTPAPTPAPTPTPSPTLTPVPSNNGGPAGS